MTETYTPSEYDEGYPEGIEDHFWHSARHHFLDRQLAKVLPPGELALDIGCGAGVYVAHARGQGFNLCGTEQGPAPVRPDMEDCVSTGTELSALPESLRQQVRVALLLDVIEHIEDRREFLRSIAILLPNCEQLLITVPARMEIWSNFDEYWGHHLRYDRPGLIEELRGSGFEAQKTSYYFNWIYLASLLLKRFGLKRETAFKSPRRNLLVRSLHRLLGLVTIIENRIAPAWLPGSTILCQAQRRSSR